MEEKNMVVTSNDDFLRYQVETGSDVIQMKDAVGTEIKVAEIFQFPTSNSEGNIVTCTSIVDSEGNIYQTLSPTVDDCAQSIWRIWKDKWGSVDIRLRVIEKISNNNRKFLTLALIR